MFGVASLISGWTNYALTLAGVTGIIVSIGVTVDSYVVFFERLKDELRSGRTFKNATPRSWNATWRTIWAANLVSIIGAVILFMLSVGSVRGFALYLGVTTFCDLLVLYTFTRPFVLLLAIERVHAQRDRPSGSSRWRHEHERADLQEPLRAAAEQPDGDRLLRPAHGRLRRRASSSSSSPWCRCSTQGLNLGLDFEGGNAWDVPASDTFDIDEAEQVLQDQRHRHRRGAHPAAYVRVGRRRHGPDRRGAQREVGRDHRRRSPTPPAWTRRRVSVAFTSSTWGAGDHREGDQGADRVLHRRVAVHQRALRVADGRRRVRRDGARRDRRRRRVLGVPVRGHARRRSSRS